MQRTLLENTVNEAVVGEFPFVDKHSDNLKLNGSTGYGSC